MMLDIPHSPSLDFGDQKTFKFPVSVLVPAALDNSLSPLT